MIKRKYNIVFLLYPVQVLEEDFAKYPSGQPDSSTQEELFGRR